MYHFGTRNKLLTCASVENGDVDFDVYDIREPSADPFPPETYVAYLQRPDIMKAIGAQVTYGECPDEPYYKIANTGDDARSFLDTLSTVVQSGISTLIWAGDAGKSALFVSLPIC